MAKDLGMICEEMLSRMSAQELTEWMAYYNLCDPNRPEREQTPEEIHAALAAFRE